MAVALRALQLYAVGVYHDDGVYVILARSLATGHGLRYLHLPGAPVATHYPPAYPLLLAALWRLMPSFPANVRLFLFANVLFVGLAAWYAQRLARDVLGWPAWGAAAAALVGTATFPFILLSGLVLSETMFAAALLAALVAGERFIGHGDRESTALPLRALTMGIGAGLLALIRTHGLALEVALLVLLAVRRRWRAVPACGLGALIVLLPWAVWKQLHTAHLPAGLEGSYGSYVNWYLAGFRASGISGVARTVAANGRELAALLADRSSLTDGSWGRNVGALLAAAAIVAGAWRLARRAPVTVAFAAIYLAVMLVWPFTPWRFLYAVWPVVVLCAGAAVAWAVRLGQPYARAAALAAAGAVMLGAARSEARAFAGRTWREGTERATAVIAPLVRRVLADTKPTDVVAADAEQLVYLLTGRTALPLVPFTAREYLTPRTVTENARAIDTLLHEVHVDYVMTVSPALRDAMVRAAAADSSLVVTPLGAVGGGAAFRVRNR